MTTVLALETATPWLGVAIVQNGVVLAEHHERIERAHAERIMPTIAALYETAKLKPHANIVAVGTGPGSYTGLRVAASVALGLATAWNARVVGVPTLQAIAAQHEGIVAASLDARKGQVYGAVYHVQQQRIATTTHAPQKHALHTFESIAMGAKWLHDQAPNAATLAHLALYAPDAPLELQYL